jgi:putative hydrolase of the HAD superfamily
LSRVRDVFFDVGGVLASNGWGHEQRAAAVAHFHLDGADLADRHEEAVGSWEMGGMTIDEYLTGTVFYRDRPFTRDAFKQFMFAQSRPFPETIELARALAATRRYRLMTLNNESAELNVFRLRHFGLTEIFVAFFTSCWVGALKPSHRIYERALAMAQAEPDAAVFIDDRERNLEVPRAFGMHTIHYHDAVDLRAALAALGVTS